MSQPIVRKLALAVLFCALASAAGLATDSAAPPSADAIQMLADVTLIDGECRDVTVDFGRAFHAAAAMGLRAVDVMPTGTLRPAFEAAARSRFAKTSHEDLCGDLARSYGERVPGLLRAR
jgi:hypothetical protein